MATKQFIFIYNFVFYKYIIIVMNKVGNMFSVYLKNIWINDEYIFFVVSENL